MESDTSIDRLAAALNAALGSVLDTEEFDITPGASGELDVSTDDWTLHLEGWPNGVAWLAIDDEPDDAAHYTAARRKLMSDAVERALAEADRAVEGALTRALAASGDPFTAELLAAMAPIDGLAGPAG
ncbi:MAG: hypothetical protein QOG89_3688 [Thermomicrobiales bacterium]|nr:hypothetical protein [Thermomicrobiales bacterium]